MEAAPLYRRDVPHSTLLLPFQPTLEDPFTSYEDSLRGMLFPPPIHAAHSSRIVGLLEDDGTVPEVSDPKLVYDPSTTKDAASQLWASGSLLPASSQSKMTSSEALSVRRIAQMLLRDE
jgi:hypothetical protein